MHINPLLRVSHSHLVAPGVAPTNCSGASEFLIYCGVCTVRYVTAGSGAGEGAGSGASSAADVDAVIRAGSAAAADFDSLLLDDQDAEAPSGTVRGYIDFDHAIAKLVARSS